MMKASLKGILLSLGIVLFLTSCTTPSRDTPIPEEAQELIIDLYNSLTPEELESLGGLGRTPGYSIYCSTNDLYLIAQNGGTTGEACDIVDRTLRINLPEFISFAKQMSEFTNNSEQVTALETTHAQLSEINSALGCDTLPDP